VADDNDTEDDDGSAGLRVAPLRVKEVVVEGRISKGLLNRDEAEAKAEAGAEGTTEDVVNIDIDDGVDDEEDGGEEADNEDEDERGMLPNIIELFILGLGWEDASAPVVALVLVLVSDSTTVVVGSGGEASASDSRSGCCSCTCAGCIPPPNIGCCSSCRC